MATYHDASRSLQDRFDTRRLADRIEERLVRDFLDAGDRAFVERADMFFLATADAEGRPQCSYKGGDPGFVRVLDEGDVLLAEYPGAQLVVRVRATQVFPNCPRYIHEYRLVQRSRFVPRSDCSTPVPRWKTREWSRDALPASDPARAPDAEVVE